jgi:hypothetical protein
MPEEVLTIVKIPLLEIAESLREKHTLPSKLTDSRIEGENLVLSFTEVTLEREEEQPISLIIQDPQKIRRQRKKRNRMKTRGWAVVGRITNSKGQKCSIYKPFVDALQDQQLTVEEQRKKVESILRANRNKPSEESTRYFLNNTLEYLKAGAHVGVTNREQ